MYKTTFAELKTRAKDVLKSNYWYSFGVCILVSLITSLGTSVATVTNMPVRQVHQYQPYFKY